MEDFEKLGQFYLGRTYDLQHKQRGPLLLYDSKDLVTHALCVGMTGSGKTGLCLVLLEEAAIDGIPALVIDPKGDLSNILLTFPGLESSEFAPWINEDDASRQGKTADGFAAEQAALWKKGLAEWGQDGGRIARLKNSADFTVYTPGSTAGVPISILNSLTAPARSVLDDPELFRDHIQTTASSLLGLVGIDADPVKSREHILLSTILQNAWTQGNELALPDLIRQIQTPPMTRVGVMDVESFFPAKERFTLAMSINNLLAAPGFDVWTTGEPLDIGRLLHTAEGKPRVSIFSLAHLGDAERMFFVSLLLNQTVGWMRTQPGTNSLRAILYMDEIAGYFPPVANPPSKGPLLTLLKQARAFGLGIVLSTQNPVDLDYKGLGNTGTWFLGRLQTERDKNRLLDGLEGAAATTGRGFDRQAMEQTLAALSNRIFLMNDVHEDAPVVFESRWALSYLRGPMERNEIKRLMEGRSASRAADVTRIAQPVPEPAPSTGAAALEIGGQPVLPPGIQPYFLPPRQAPGGLRLVYHPMVYGTAQVRFVDTKCRIDTSSAVAVVVPIDAGPVSVDWSRAVEVEVAPSDLEQTPATNISFAQIPPNVVKANGIANWQKEFVIWIYGTQSFDLLRDVGSGQLSQPGETERDFRIRLQQTFREERDQAVEQLRKKYAPKIAAAQERLRRAQQAVERESEQAKAQGFQAAISLGATLLGSLMGRKTLSTSTLGRATTAARGAARTLKESQDIGRAKETVETIGKEIAQLEEALREETTALEARFNDEPLETVSCKPKKTNIAVKLLAFVWAPYTATTDGTATPAW